MWTLTQLIRERIDCVYADCWFFFYGKYHLILPFQVLTKLLRIKFVSDLRDPYVEHEVASGSLQKGSAKERYIRTLANISHSLTDLLVVPSEEYRGHFARVKDSSEILPVYRGVDDSKFNPAVKGDTVREVLGLQDHFVIGWFGIMRTYRRIQEIIIPLIEKTASLIPKAHFLIGGSGPLKGEFLRLKERNPHAPFRYMGFIPYDQIPQYVAACDVILCPISTEFEHGRYSLWLRYSESIAMGRPLLATKTPACIRHFGKLRGVMFVDDDIDQFLNGLVELHKRYNDYRRLALDDALNFGEYTIRISSRKIVDAILRLPGLPLQGPTDSGASKESIEEPIAPKVIAQA